MLTYSTKADYLIRLSYPERSSFVFMTTAILIKSACPLSPTGVVLNALENFMIFVRFFSKFNASGKFFSGSMFDTIDT